MSLRLRFDLVMLRVLMGVGMRVLPADFLYSITGLNVGLQAGDFGGEVA